MPRKQTFDDYRDELVFQRSMWERKDSLRAVYRRWYRAILDALSVHDPTVELGSGSGNFKEFAPHVVATDAIDVGEWLDELVDARELPYGEASVGNFVMIDVLHHLQRPIDVLRAASHALVEGGRIVILEPAGTPWAKVVFGACHHEPYDRSQDLWGEDGTPEPPNPDFDFANQAMCGLLFGDRIDDTMRRLPDLEHIDTHLSDFLVYPATGGFSYLNLVPKRMVDRMIRLEDRATRRTRRWTAMRMLVVLEKASVR